MRERDRTPTTIRAQRRRLRRSRHPCAVPRTSLQCACTRRRNCIAQLSPSREYALRTVDFPARNSATIELTHYPHGSGSRRRITFANSSPEARFCRWLLQSVDRAESDTLTLTQEFLAEMLGVRRTSVTEVAPKFRRRELSITRVASSKILDRPALEKMSCDFWINRFSCAKLA